MAEKLAAQQPAGEVGAVEGVERAPPPPAEALDRGGHHLLPSTRFTSDQDGHVDGRDLLDRPEQRLHRRALADDPVKRRKARVRHLPSSVLRVFPPADTETPSLTRGCPSGLGAGRDGVT